MNFYIKASVLSSIHFGRELSLLSIIHIHNFSIVNLLIISIPLQTIYNNSVNKIPIINK